MAPFLRSQAAAYVLLPLAAACWAGNHIVARAAGGHVPPASLAVLRWIVIVVVVLPFALAHLRADWPKLKSNAGLMLLFAAVGGGAFGTLQFVALHFTTALNMGVVGSVAPAFIVAVSWLLFRDRLSGLQLLGVMISLTGVLAIVSRLDVARLASFSFNGGDLIIIANMMLWAIYSACLRLRPDIHPMTFMLSMAVIAGLGNVPFALLRICLRLPAAIHGADAASRCSTPRSSPRCSLTSPGTAASTSSVRRGRARSCTPSRSSARRSPPPSWGRRSSRIISSASS